MRPADTALSHARTRRGFNLVEAAIVLGVVGLVIGATFIGFSSIRLSKQATDTAFGIIYYCTEMRRIYDRNDAPPVSVDITSTTAKMSTTPEGWIYKNTRLYPPFVKDQAVSYSEAQFYWYSPTSSGPPGVGNIGGAMSVWLRFVPISLCYKILGTSQLENASSVAFFVQVTDTSSNNDQNGILPYSGKLTSLCDPLASQQYVNITVMCRPE